MRMMTKLLAACALAVTAGAANAATFDFQAIADKASFKTTTPATLVGKEADWATVVGGAAVGILDVASGISVVATGSGNNGSGGTSGLNAYFDSGSAGLGVCGTLTSKGQCNPSNDDNVGSIGGTANSSGPSFESLILTFSSAVKATAINLAGEGHGNFGGSVKINGILFGAGSFSGNGDFSAMLSAALSSLGAASVWTFQYVPTSQVSSTDEFYIDSISVAPVPVPAAGLLLLGALGGLAALRRRRTA
jgi:hypothetical protein